jgi:hypothetical protein
LLSEIAPNFGFAIDPQHRVRINGSRHFYDFALTKESKPVAFVEFDGIQHRKAVRWSKSISDAQSKKNLKETRKRDDEKDVYSLKHLGRWPIRIHSDDLEKFHVEIKAGKQESETELYRELERQIWKLKK